MAWQNCASSFGLRRKDSDMESNDQEYEVFLRQFEPRDVRPLPESAHVRRPRPYGRAVAVLATAAAIVLGLFVAMRMHRTPNVELRALVESADGGLFRVSGGEALRHGDRVQAGDVVRSDGGVGTVLALADGSRIEMRAKTALSVEPANDGVRIRLDTGGVIVTAAKQKAGHLYVQTKDINVSVVGTVFFVNTEEAGSRVAVIQGEVLVQQGAVAKKLRPGQQTATNPLFEAHPLREEIAWSRSAEEHMALLQAAPAVAPQARKLEFEVASLRESQMDPRALVPSFVECRGVDGVWSYAKEVAGGGPGTVSTIPVPQGRCVGVAALRPYIAAAYGIRPTRISVDDGPLMQPKPMGPIAFYQLEAKAENPLTATKDELRQMLENLVISRFKLKAHRYTEEQQGYLLLVSKSGIKFKETTGDEDLPRSRVDLPPDFVLGPGAIMPHVIKGKFLLKRFVDFLSSGPTQGKPVIDKTDLTGLYDITLRLNQVISPPGVRGGNANGVEPEMWDPPLAKALEEQLGLRLESAGKIPVEYLLVDHVEKPSEN
jgi:uncharacterized protein (TIGR03435 family)